LLHRIVIFLDIVDVYIAFSIAVPAEKYVDTVGEPMAGYASAIKLKLMEVEGKGDAQAVQCSAHDLLLAMCF
jgi:hypothetical protein